MIPQWMVRTLKIETELGNGILTSFIIVLLILQFDQRWRVIYYTFILSLYIIMNVVLKMLDEQGRPSWYDPSIVVGKFNCNLEFGNPSGHALEAAAVSLSMYLDFMLTFKGRGKAYTLCAIAFLPLPVTYTLTMGLSRVVVGVHAWNQVIQGWLLGLWLALFCSLICRDAIQRHVNSLLSGNSIYSIGRYAKILITFFLINFGILAGLFVTVSSDLRKMRISEQLVANIESVCQDRFQPEESFHVVGLKDAAFALMFFGAAAGLLLQTRFFHG